MSPQESGARSTLALPRLALRIWAVITVVIVIATLGIIVWSLNKGFDFTDEAWVYSLTASNRVATGEAWGFQHLMHPVFVALGQSVVAFRVLRLIGYLLVSAIVVWAVRTVMDRLGMRLSRWNWAFVLAAAQIGTFFPCAFGPQYISYNELAAWFTQIGVALLAVLVTVRLTLELPPRWSTLLLWAAAGAILVLLTVSKVTSGVPFAAALIIVLVVRNTGAVLWQRIVATVVGIIVPLLILLLFGFPLSGYITNLLQLAFNSNARAALGHPIGEILGVYWTSLSSTVETVLPAVVVLLFALVVLASLMLRRATMSPTIYRAAVVTTSLAAVVPFTFKADWFSYMGLLTVYIGFAAVFSSAFLLRPPSNTPFVETPSARRLDVPAIICVAVLGAATPFMSTLGSGNPLAPELLWCMTLWSAVLAFGLVYPLQYLYESGSRLWMLPAALVLSLVAVTASAVWREANHPYRTAALSQQHASSTAPYFGGLRLSQAEASWSSWLHRQAVSLHANGVPTIALNSPGALLSFNNSSFASPWVADFWTVSFQSIQAACTSVKPTSMYVLQPADVPLNSASAVGATKALRESCGFDFPDDFKKVAEYPSSDPSLQLTIWRLR